MSEQMIDFAIITALDVERQAVCQAFGMSDRHRVRKESRTYWHKQLKLRNGEFYEIVVTQFAGMANVDAVSSTKDLIHHWNPGAILLVGIAAGIDSETQHLGDLVLGSHVYYYERGKMTPDGKKLEPYTIEADATLWDRASHSATWKSTISKPRPDHSKVRPKIHQGVIASGEKVIAAEGFRNELIDEQRKIAAIEMEGYGFSHAVRQNFGQIRHLVMKAICDWADESKNKEWQPYAAAVAAGFAKHFLRDRPLDPLNQPHPIYPHRANTEDSHYIPIINALKSGNLVPFLGPGINPYFYKTLASQFAEFVEQELPHEGEEYEELIRRIIGIPCSVCHYWPKDRPQGCPMLTGIDRVAECPLFIEQELAVSNINLRYLSHYYILKNNQDTLYAKLYEILEKIEYKDSQALHQFLAVLPRLMSSKGYPQRSPGLPYQLIVTTNYDDILEQAFSKAKQPFDVVSYVADGNERGKFKHRAYEGNVQTIDTQAYDKLPLRSPWGNAAQPRPIILKLFGDWRNLWDNGFVTTDQQVTFLIDKLAQNLPDGLKSVLERSNILFMGYSPSNTDLDRIIHCLWPGNRIPNKSYLLHQAQPGDLGQEIWTTRNVDLLSMPFSLDDFVTQLNKGIEAQISVH